MLGCLAYFNGHSCNLSPHGWDSKEALLAVLTVAITGKIIVGPSSTAFTSYFVTKAGKATRPLSYRLFDFVTALPVNIINALTTKVATFTLFWIVFWLAGKVGFQDGTTTLVLPLYITTAWTILSLGRWAQMIVNAEKIERNVGSQVIEYEKILGKPWAEAFERNVMQKLSWKAGLKVRLLIAVLLSLAATYVLLEKALRDCNALPNSGLPSMATVLAGLALLPVIEGIFVVVVDAMTNVFHHQ